MAANQDRWRLTKGEESEAVGGMDFRPMLPGKLISARTSVSASSMKAASLGNLALGGGEADYLAQDIHRGLLYKRAKVHHPVGNRGSSVGLRGARLASGLLRPLLTPPNGDTT
jgi:hypothetical protein